MADSFEVGIEFESVLSAISKQIYETPLAFVRENVQNAVDAIRLQSSRSGPSADDGELRVDVIATESVVEIRDNGIGMTLDDLRNLFWTIGASGKRTPEARAAGCVGMFGIGGFANFGVCSALSVISQTMGQDHGYTTSLSRDSIEASVGSIPTVQLAESTDAAPRGTVVRGELIEPADVEGLKAYLVDFVQYAEEPVYFNGQLISGSELALSSAGEDRLSPITQEVQEWTQGNVLVRGRLLEGPGHVLYAELHGVEVGGDHARLEGWLRFENGAVDVLKRGFKLCATSVSSHIGIAGAIDCDLLSPTAGRDSLDSESASVVKSIASCMERAAVLAVLTDSDRISQHTRVFRYVRSHGLIPQMDKVIVDLADGSQSTLGQIEERAQAGIKAFYATTRESRIAHLLQARGHLVVLLPSDSHKQRAVREFLTSRCNAEPMEGRVECSETYEELTRFEKLFLSEMEETILAGFEVTSARLVPGKLTEDIPVYAAESKGDELTIYVDVRHDEVTKLKDLGITSLFRSMVAAFCREYLGPTLKAHSPKFFGSGAVNLDFLSKRRSELWVLLTDDIQVLSKGNQRQVVRQSDVTTVHAGGGGNGDVAVADDAPKEPKLVRIEGASEYSQIFGYYLRIPTPATRAYGDVIQQSETRASVWVGNKVLFVASDGLSTAFQFEVRLDELLKGEVPGVVGSGADEEDRPIQALFGGLYFPIPEQLEEYLVPTGSRDVRIEVRCDWIDFSTARSWEPTPAAV